LKEIEKSNSLNVYEEEKEKILKILDYYKAILQQYFNNHQTNLTIKRLNWNL